MNEGQEVDSTLLQESLDRVYSLSYRQGDLESYLDSIVATVARLLHQDWVAITLLAEGGAERVLASSLESFDKDRLYEYHGSVSDTVLRTGRPLTLSNAQRDTRYGSLPEGYCAYLGVPLFNVQGKSVGTICSFHQTERAYSAEQVRIATVFAERASIAIDNYQLYLREVGFKEHLEQEVADRTRELERTQARLIERERLAAIGEFASAIVHEVRSPLSTIGMALEYLDRRERQPGALRRLEIARREGLRLEKLLEEILAYARPHGLTVREVSVPILVQEVTEGLKAGPEGGRTPPIHLSSTPPLRVTADEDKLRQVLINVIGNALEASPPEDTVEVGWEAGADEWLRIRVRNGGEAIPPDLLPRLSEAFYSTKPHGTGLGLAIVRRIMEQHQGRLEISSDARHGTLVTLTLPIGPAVG